MEKLLGLYVDQKLFKHTAFSRGVFMLNIFKFFN